ncbi:TPA: hypothetical protein ACX6RT_004034 [Photobacterium damselae]
MRKVWLVSALVLGGCGGGGGDDAAATPVKNSADNTVKTSSTPILNPSRNKVASATEEKVNSNRETVVLNNREHQPVVTISPPLSTDKKLEVTEIKPEDFVTSSSSQNVIKESAVKDIQQDHLSLDKPAEIADLNKGISLDDQTTSIAVNPEDSNIIEESVNKDQVKPLDVSSNRVGSYQVYQLPENINDVLKSHPASSEIQVGRLLNISRLNNKLNDYYDVYGARDKLSFKVSFLSAQETEYTKVACRWISEGETSAQDHELSTKCEYQLSGNEYLKPLLIEVRYYIKDQLHLAKFRYQKRFLIDRKSNTLGSVNLYNDSDISENITLAESGLAQMNRSLSEEFKHNIRKVEANYSGFAAINMQGNLFTWGTKTFIGEEDYLQTVNQEKIVDVVPSLRAFAVLNEYGQVHVVGSLGNFTDTLLQDQFKFTQMMGNKHAFALKTENGQVCLVTDKMTKADFSGTCKYLKQDAPIAKFVGLGQDFNGFAILTTRGELVEWGSASHEYKQYLRDIAAQKVKVSQEQAEKEALAKEKGDLSDTDLSPSTSQLIQATDAKTHFNWDLYFDKLRNIDNNEPSLLFNDLVVTDGAFAALTKNKKVIVWGISSYGGSPVYDYAGFKVKLVEDTTTCKESNKTFYTQDGCPNGLKRVPVPGYYQQMRVNEVNQKLLEPLENIKKVVANHGAFAALTESGQVLTWGSVFYGGNTYSHELKGLHSELENAKDIMASDDGFTALFANGKTLSWKGIWNLSAKKGDQVSFEKFYDYDSVSTEDKYGWFRGFGLKDGNNVGHFITNGEAFMAISGISDEPKAWISSWGNKEFGGGLLDSTRDLIVIPEQIIATYPDHYGFTFVTAYGDVYSWSGNDRGTYIGSFDIKKAAPVSKTQIQ